MIDIFMNTIPGQKTTDPWETADASANGQVFSVRSRSCAICKLAREMVGAGIPDDQWQAYTPEGTHALRGLSIHRMAKLSISEADRGGLSMVPHREWRASEPS